MTAAPKNLGALDGPVLLFGGPYSNLEATRALKAEADRLGIPADHTICTGDVVAYCGDPAATVAEIRDWGCHVVMGNCEEALGEGGVDCKCGFEKGSSCDLLAVKWFSYASSQLDDDARAWMRALPHPVTFELAGEKIAVVHGHERDISEWVFASTPEDEKAAALDCLGVSAVVGGHSGLPFSQVLKDGRLWHNPGVVGMPANDGTRRVWYSLLEPLKGGGLHISHKALEFDWRAAQARMAAADLPAPYRENLETGIWPNQDILPAAEHARMGSAIDETAFEWAADNRAVA